MSFDLSHYRDLYFSEAHEQLELIADGLRGLERAPGDRAAMDAAFRAAHTLKGMSATMGYDDLTASAHALEDLLEKVRSDTSGATSPHVRLLFHALDDLTSLTARAESVDPLRTNGRELPTPTERTPVEAEPTAPVQEQAPSGFAPFVRVSVQQLDQLTNLVATLVVSSNQIARGSTLANVGHHHRLIKTLQSLARQLRMTTIGDLFNRYPRILREMARDQGKQIRVTIEGEEVELARAMLDELNEPLLHLLRNAVAHGIETSEERAHAGKDPVGTISLRARQMEEKIIVQVGDDGRGLNAEQILQAACEHGFISEEQCSRMSEAEVFNLIMIPGFSLSSAVTQAAGRGVGMDAVKFKVQSLHGTINIHSEQGRGTTFTLAVPRILGPIEYELVRVADQVYALPTARVARTLTLAREDIARLATGEWEPLLPPLRLLDLKSLLPAMSPALAASRRSRMERAPLNLRDDAESPSREMPPAEYGIIITNSSEPIALRVDELLGKALLTRPLGEAARLRDDEPPLSFLDLDQLLSA